MDFYSCWWIDLWPPLNINLNTTGDFFFIFEKMKTTSIWFPLFHGLLGPKPCFLLFYFFTSCSQGMMHKWPFQTAEPWVTVLTTPGNNQRWGHCGTSTHFSSLWKPQCTLLRERLSGHLKEPGRASLLLKCMSFEILGAGRIFFPTVVPYPHPSSPLQCASDPFIHQFCRIGKFSCRTDVTRWDRSKLRELSPQSEHHGAENRGCGQRPSPCLSSDCISVTSLNFSVFICKIRIIPALWNHPVLFYCKGQRLIQICLSRSGVLAHPLEGRWVAEDTWTLVWIFVLSVLSSWSCSL